MILSSSRRTDIPGYYSDWLINRLKDGYVLTKNPMNPNQVSRIKLSPELIDCIVLWTKDPQNMMEKLPILDSLGYPYYFQFTLTPYGRGIERNLRDKEDILATFRQLSKRIGRDRVMWRYDPIILNSELTMDYHRENFERLCSTLKGYTDICTISFVDIYSKLSKQVRQDILLEITKEQMHQIASLMSCIARQYDIELRVCCCETTDLTADGIIPAACIEKDMVEKMCGHTISVKKDKYQRPGCGCVQSVDIGVYNTCSNGCVYCYANHSEESVKRNCRKHNPNSDILIGEINSNVKIIDRN